jgi:hypothetical protein
MNMERMEQLARAFETDTLPIQFNMDVFFQVTECGTFGCIAGETIALFNPGSIITSYKAKNARKILGLNEDQATDLFYDYGFGEEHDKPAAAKRIRAMIAAEQERSAP